MKLFKKIENYETDFTTCPRVFEGYRWYKPIIIAILAVILYLILFFAFTLLIPQLKIMSLSELEGFMNQESAVMNNLGGIITSLTVVLMIPALYIPSKLLRERPFSSYLSSVGGWNWKIFFKSSAIAIIVYAIITGIELLFEGGTFNNQFTILTFILCIVITPFQCFAEEYVCRGFVMQTLGSWFKIPVVAIAVQAIFFTVLHNYNLIGQIDVLITGLVFGFLAWYTKGLEVSSALHTINNIITFLVLGFGFAESTTQISPIDLATSLAVLFISVGLIFFIDRKYNWIGLKKEVE